MNNNYLHVGPRIADFLCLTPFTPDKRFSDTEMESAQNSLALFQKLVQPHYMHYPLVAYAIFVREGYRNETEIIKGLVRTVFGMCMDQLCEKRGHVDMMFEKLWRDAMACEKGRLDNYWPAETHDVRSIYVLVSQDALCLNIGLFAFDDKYYAGKHYHYDTTIYPPVDNVVTSEAKKENTMSDSQQPAHSSQLESKSITGLSLETNISTAVGETTTHGALSYGDMAFNAVVGDQAISTAAPSDDTVPVEEEPAAPTIEAPASISAAVNKIYTDPRTGQTVKFNATYAEINPEETVTSHGVKFLLERTFHRNITESKMKGMFDKVADWTVPRLMSFDLFALPQTFVDVVDISGIYVVSGVVNDLATVTFVVAYHGGFFNMYYTSTQALI